MRPTRQQRRIPPEHPRGQRTTSKIFALLTVALTLYLGTLWFGIAIIGDNPVRSALMAGLIVAIAALGYMFSSQPVRPEE